MKKIWALGLAVVVLLGVIFVTVLAAEAPKPAISAYGVRLSESIAIEFCATGLKAGQSYTVNFEKDGVATGNPVIIKADSNGNATIIYDKLTPAEIAVRIKLSFDADGTTVTKEHSVLEYCAYQLANMSESDTLWTLIVDLLNYGAAAQAYTNDTGVAANNELSALQRAMATQSFVAPTESVQSEKINDPIVRWTNYSMALGKSVKYRYFFTVADGVEVSDVTFLFSNGTENWTVSGSTAKIENDEYVVDFLNLTPADLYTDITVVAKDQNGNVLSNTVTFSAARYAAYFKEEEGTALSNLLDSILCYATSAAAYVENPTAGIPGASLRSLTEGELSIYEQYRIANAPADNGGIPLYGINLVNAVYARAGIDGNAFLWKILNNPEAALFTDGVLTTNTGSSLYKMLVPNSYGGTEILDSNDNWLIEKQYQIGDVLNWYDGTAHYAGVYQGEGKFLVVNTDTNAAGVTKSLSEIAAEKSSYNWYFVLRPTDLVITREDMEESLKDVLWAYYTKGTWAQYESTTFNAISYTHGGYSPLGTHMNTLEDATEDTTLYTVCSNYAWSAYYEALGFPLFGYCLNPGSAYLWIMADEVPADADGDMLCVMRWHNYPCNHTSQDGDRDEEDEDNNHSSIQHSKDICCGYGNTVAKDGTPAFDLKTAYDELYDYFLNYDKNLRPGDIIRLPGHVVVYAGDGWILEAGGSKYNKEYGYDGVETNGVIHATKLMDYFFPENGNTSFRLAKFNSGSYAKTNISERNLAGICVLRPLDLLTTDDGDDDPSNDLLNLNYYHAAVEHKTDTGYETLTWQLEQDTVELAHTGYTIQPGTYTRMMFPMMNINRTVNIGAYGTAVKGGTITYTIEIRNQSNNEKFVTTSEEGYAGQDYVGVPIVETIPENVELVSAEGATLIDGVLYWSLDVAAGEIGSVSYTVKVTGDMGAEIVNGGGLVGGIPSNTLVNTIGGQKISDEAQAKLLAFYKAGRKEWNSNDGYKISASTSQDGSVFAEQIYNVMGLSLDLPDLEDLLQMLFDREEIKISKGTWVGYRKPASSSMLTLKDQTEDSNNQIWRDMVINGSYFGGNYVWTNNLDEETRRVSIPRTEDLMPGDFIICMDVLNIADTTKTCEVKNWKVLIYLGEDKYASLTSDGVLSACDGPRELVGSIVYDVFIGMRPSQAYENVNQNIASGTLADLTDADKAWQAGKPSTIVLNEEYKSNFESMVMENVDEDSYLEINGANITPGLPMIGEVYALAGVNISNNVVSKVSYKALTYLLFNDVTSDNAFGREYHRLDQPVYGYESIYNMLMFYDGRAYVDKNALTSMNDLLVGDVIVLGSAAGKAEQVLIYRGGGRFMTSTDSPIGGFYMSEWLELKTFKNTEELLAYLDGFVRNRKNEIIRGGVYWDGYLVLRPSRGFYDINEPLVPAPPAAAGRELTEQEKAAIAAITLEQVAASGKFNLGGKNGIGPWIYAQAGIDVSAFLDNTAAGTLNGLMSDSGIKTDSKYYSMTVYKSWGGEAVKSGTGEYVLALADFKIGDLLVIKTKGANNAYWTALYQGNGKFLVETRSEVADFVATYDELFAMKNGTTIGDVTFEAWSMYAVLRPSNMLNALPLRDITEKALTAEEKAIIADLTADYGAIGGNSLSNLATWAYSSASIDVSEYFTDGFDVSDVYNVLFVDEKLKVDRTNNWYKMLVQGSFDGYKIDYAQEAGADAAGVGTAVQLRITEYKVGDIFCGSNADGVFWSALYQDNGTFLVLKSSGEIDLISIGEDQTVADNTWMYYFVLRPDNLSVVSGKIPLPLMPA